MLTAERARLLFDYDPRTGVLSWRSSGSRAGHASDRGWRRVKVDGKTYREHRVIWLWMTGDWPSDQIDHDNRIRDDNRWANSSDATQTQNQRNRNIQRNNSSGTTGVGWHAKDQRWRARIKVGGRYRHLGAFTDKTAAVAARRAAETEIGFRCA